MEATLVILAAGLGSRFGYDNGLKQMQEVGPSLETIGDYSAFDAKKAGFTKVVFVITKTMEKAFYEQVVKHLEPHISCDFAYQDVNDYPSGFSFEREKPWGTGHALLVAKNAVKEPFMVIHADDFYGRDAYEKTYQFLKNAKNDRAYSMVGYYLENTVSIFGTVNRGLCEVDEKNMLTAVKEARGIHSNGAFYYEDEIDRYKLSKNQIVSMGCWGFKPCIFLELERAFENFLTSNPANTKEFDLPAVVNDLIQTKKATMEVLSSHDDWYGVTYEADKEKVVLAIADMVKKGVYPKELWRE